MTFESLDAESSFLPRCMKRRRGLAIILSVRPSVCLSNACDKTEERSV